jgi:hypothetical protein
MDPNTWLLIFTSMKYIAYLGVFLYYLMPEVFVLRTPDGKLSYLFLFLIIYLILLAILSLVYYFQNKKKFAETVALWKIVPIQSGSGSVFKEGKLKKINGNYNVLSESDVMDFMAESFSFGFFVSMDNSSIETVNGRDLSAKNTPYQNLMVVPGAYNISLDPLHETMRIAFKTYKTDDYEVTIPTIKSRRWHQILITIEGRTADIYQNGVLIKTVPLPNVVSARPGNPYLIMNSHMYARVALIQAWPRRLKESEIITNYRLNIDAVGVPRYPTGSSNLFGIPNFNLCIGSFCIGSAEPVKRALNHVVYEYS